MFNYLKVKKEKILMSLEGSRRYNSIICYNTLSFLSKASQALSLYICTYKNLRQ